MQIFGDKMNGTLHCTIKTVFTFMCPSCISGFNGDNTLTIEPYAAKPSKFVKESTIEVHNEIFARISQDERSIGPGVNASRKSAITSL